MNVPQHIRDEVRDRLWQEADRLNWPALTASDKSRYYTIWTEAKDLGGRLANFMDPRQVRVYIKDTLLKSYTREAMADHSRPFRVLGIAEDVVATASYIKPHGRLLSDGRQIAWSRASEWKATLLALHERSYAAGRPFAAIFSETNGKFSDIETRKMIEEAGQKLAIERIIWLD